VQVFLGVLDLIGVALIGILGSLAISGVASREPGNRVFEILKTLHLQNETIQTQAAIIGSIAALILVFKTVLSVVLTRKILFFLSRRGSSISTELISKLLSQSLQKFQEKSLQSNLYAVTVGVSKITVGILATFVTLIADLSLLIILILGLFIVDALVASSTILIFGTIGVLLYKLMSNRANQLGNAQAELNIQSNRQISEVLGSFRESVVHNRRSHYAREIGKQRLKLANVVAEVAFMPNVSKYAVELTMVLGSLLICAIQFAFKDATQAVAVLSVSLAASTRIAPAILRLQQGAIAIRTNIGEASPTLDLLESLVDVKPVLESLDPQEFAYSSFEPSIHAKSLSLTYPGGNSPAVYDLSFSVNKGEFIAIVGPSGAGKTTLVDTLLGVVIPDSGSILISGLAPLEAIAKWPGGISYVPQNIMIIEGTVRENIALGYPPNLYPDKLIWDALKVAKLDHFVGSLPNGLDSKVGEGGATISGGQKQRLGIARAMFTKPKLLVLDEATSSLDSQTEEEVSLAIKSLRGEVTVIMIAHRLSTVKSADSVVYLDKGTVISMGSFEKVRTVVSDFDTQAKLMGL
jgi:ABC-type bacteriocin/lantibiotic exporter with double-glycine peptidase domain